VTLNPKVQGSIPCASTIFVPGRAPTRQDVPLMRTAVINWV
jgi:hypothetical protein